MSASGDRTENARIVAFLEGIHRRCPEYTPVLETLGDLYTKEGRIEEGLAIDQKLTGLSPGNEMYHYNLACSLALLGRTDEAMASLEKAVSLGYADWAWMLKDADLKSLRKLPAFVAMLATIKQRNAGD